MSVEGSRALQRTDISASVVRNAICVETQNVEIAQDTVRSMLPAHGDFRIRSFCAGLVDRRIKAQQGGSVIRERGSAVFAAHIFPLPSPFATFADAVATATVASAVPFLAFQPIGIAVGALHDITPENAPVLQRLRRFTPVVAFHLPALACLVEARCVPISSPHPMKYVVPVAHKRSTPSTRQPARRCGRSWRCTGWQWALRR